MQWSGKRRVKDRRGLRDERLQVGAGRPDRTRRYAEYSPLRSINYKARSLRTMWTRSSPDRKSAGRCGYSGDSLWVKRLACFLSRRRSKIPLLPSLRVGAVPACYMCESVTTLGDPDVDAESSSWDQEPSARHA